MHILLIEDDPTLNQNIKDALLAERFIVDNVFDGTLAERMLKKNDYDCVIMDVNLPGKNGFDLCKEFRTFNASTPILLLTAFDELEDKIKGFDCGADDYLTKPFFMKELLLRIQSLLKRTKFVNSRNEEERRNLTFDDIVVNTLQKTVFRQDQEIVLTPREYQILLKLIEYPGNLVSKNELIKEIWGQSVGVNTNTIEVYINFLRNKIDKPFGKNSIKTKIGYGYFIQ